ncbi:hypothetical protein QZH41_001993 [Actinostola sp. cb2023]|nr:hypothetical protein QZH41_001993 [Actinostola sp. cb2023]
MDRIGLTKTNELDQNEDQSVEATALASMSFAKVTILRRYFDRCPSHYRFLPTCDMVKVPLHQSNEVFQGLKIFEYPTKLQALVEKLPGWFANKWSSKVQTLQERQGCDAFPSFADFVNEVSFHADRMNIPQIRHQFNAKPTASSNNSSSVTSPFSGSSRTRRPDSLLDKLQVTTQEVNLQVNTIVGCNTIRTKKVFGLHIQDVNNEHMPIKVPYAYTRESIPASKQDIASNDLAKQWPHLSKIADKICYRPDIGIGMLIGRNVPTAFQPMGVITGKADEPWAEKYKFGWTVIGRVCKDKIHTTEDPITSRASVNCTSSVQETSIEHTSVTSPFVTATPSKDTTSPAELRQMMELDYNELHHSRKIPGTEQVESIEDIRFRKVLDGSIHKNQEGNWECPLPFKTEDVILPNNKNHCLRRLLSLKRKLATNDKLKSDYVGFIQKMLDRGHASQVPTDELNTLPGKVWYLPHFNVYHPKKPDQIRVVFDCSAVYQDESLNKHLLQGPDQLNSLVGVLTRFRKEEVAFTCDIEQMFPQLLC